MKTHSIPALKLTIVCLVVFVGFYSILMWGCALVFASSKGTASVLRENGKVVGSQLVGQAFLQDKYFWSRPSAVGYNGGGSCGSNKGPSNPDYLAQVQARVDSFLAHNPEVQKAEIPSEMVTASGSGLDPHISPMAAKIQIARIAKIRGLEASKLNILVEENTEKPLLGMFGTAKIHVLQLNLALDRLSK